MLQKNICIEVFALKNSHEHLVQRINETIGTAVFYAEADSLKNRFTGHLHFLLKNPFLYLRRLITSSSPQFDLRKRFLRELHNVKYIAERNPDHLHAHFGCRAADIAFLAHLMTGVNFTFTTHRRDIFETPPQNYRLKSRYAKKHITISEFNKNYLAQHFGVDPHTIEVIHCGVDSDRIKPLVRADKELSPRIITVARLSAEKGLENLIRACSILRAKGIRFHCDIVGDGHQRDLLRSLIHKLNLQDELTMLGGRTNDTVLQLMQKADLMVLPSRSEGISVSVMEAMACGIPVLTTDITGIRELIEDGVTGFIVPPENAQALANKLILLLQKQKMRMQVVPAARNKIVTDFDLKKQTSKLLSVWKS